MAGLAGLGSIREPAPEDLEKMDVRGLDAVKDEQTTNIIVDPETGHVSTFNDDGSVDIDTDPKAADKQDGPVETEFNDNLAMHMSETDLATLAAAIYEGVENDIKTRSDFDEIFTKGIDLLGLKLEPAASTASAEGTVSRFHHSLLLETVVKYQANFVAEMLPASGPVKVRDDQPEDPDSPPPNPNNPAEVIQAQHNKNRDVIAENFETDFNHYLTVTATEFYPDTDRMAFVQGFSGNAFKKQFHCPLRKRPVSESVPPQDLIVSNNATDLQNALRVTHRTKTAAATLKRLQLNKTYRNVAIPTPQPTVTRVAQKIGDTEGVDKTPQLPADYEHTMYETLIDIDLKGFEHRVDDDDEYDPEGDISGLPLPYRVTMERDSQLILSIRRNWKEDDDEFQKKLNIVHYPLIPGLGFLAYGFIHLLGNTTRALTAATRLMIDAGQFSCFPGFLMAKGGSKQNTNDMRVSPGTGKEIDTMGKPIQEVVMKLPYNEPSQALMALVKQMAEDGMRLGAAPQIPVGEGRADVPVGTMLMAIEQTTKMMGAIHKRNHSNFALELKNLRDLFIEDPTALSRFATKPTRKWELAEEFADKDLVPASDPNIPSQMHRIMIATAMVQTAGTPVGMQIYDQLAVHERAWRTIGVTDVGGMFKPPQATPPDPQVQLQQTELQLKQQELQGKAQDRQLKTQENQRKAQETLLDQNFREKEQQAEFQNDREQRQHDLMITNMKLGSEHAKERHKGIVAAQTERVRHAGGIISATHQHLHDRITQHADQQHEKSIKGMEHAQEQHLARAGQVHELISKVTDHKHETEQTEQQQQHDRQSQVIDHASKDHLQKTKPQPKPGVGAKPKSKTEKKT